MSKLTRNAKFLIFSFMIVLFIVVGIIVVQILYPHDEGKNQEKPQYTLALVAEDQTIASTYIDSISKEKTSETYNAYQIDVKKGTKIGKYTLSQDQSFTKYIKITGPDGKAVISNKSKQVVTHNAYSMLLTGDIVEKTNISSKEKTYEIINARVTYNQIPFVLLSNENSVCIANKAKSKEKIVNLQDFINALKTVDKRDSMMSW